MLRLSIVSALCAFGSLGWWLSERGEAPSPSLEVVPHSVRAAVSLPASEPAIRSAGITPPPVPAAPNPESIAFGAAFNGFTNWIGRYLGVSPAERPALIEEGVRLAQARRTYMVSLIEKDPREALARAIPMAARQLLPGEIVSLLERRVSDRGFFGVIGVLGDASQTIKRTAQLSDGNTYEAFVYGRRTKQATVPEAYISGVALDTKLAVDERPLRVLEAGEKPKAVQIFTQCPVSGKTTTIDASSGELPPITKETPAVEIAGGIHYFCSAAHIAAVEEQLEKEEGGVAQEGSSGGGQRPTGSVSTYNTGPKTHLYMRVTFADQLTDPQAEKDCYDMMRQVNDFMIECSYGKCYFITTVTPLLVLPRTEAWYNINTSTFANEVLLDARVAAKAAGYDPAAYDFDTVRYNNGPGGFSGQAYVGGKGCWLKSSSVGVACHEYGHNLGLWHANFWNTNPVSVIGPGTNQEYGNVFDTMGSASAGNNHYGAYAKTVLNWMTPELVTTVRQSGTYRIFTHDQVIADPARHYGLKVTKDTDRDYWCELRQKFTSIPWMMSGIQITWDTWGTGSDTSANGSNGGPQLLDTTPGSPDGKNDAQLVIGRTFSDLEAGIHITPIGKGGTTPESMDVVVNLGLFPADQAPVLSTLAASTLAAATSQVVTFTATASDPDGDLLAYAWDFGDRTFGISNAPVATKSWTTAGSYTVRCTVSDMKGKVATKFVVVTVGTTSAVTVSGTVTGPAGQPLEGVLVSNNVTTTAYRGAYTDSAGNYTISNVDPGSYTLTALLPGYTLTASGFANPLTVSGTTTAINFTAADVPSLSIQAIDPSARENSTDTGTYRITRTGPITAAKIARVTFPSGTATKGSDYTLAPDPTYNATSSAYELTIPANSATLDVVLTPVNDATAEGPETAILQLVPITGLNIVGPSQATVTIDDDDTALPRVKIIANDDTANEAGDPGQFTVSRTGPTDAPLTVSYAASGTANNGIDYQSLSGAFVIPAGASSATIDLVPINDSLVEGTEIATLTINTSANYVRDSVQLSASVTIADDDLNVVTVQATDNAASETTDVGTFTITRTGDLTNALTVEYDESGTALHGTDYLRLVGTATIPAGQNSTTVSIVPINDLIGEVAQTATLQLRSKTNYLVGTPFNATVTIADNDAPTFSLGPVDGVATKPTSGTGTDTGTVRIYRAGTSATPITVNYSVGGTAVAGNHYTALTGSVVFASADLTKDIVITPLGNGVFEEMKTVVVTIVSDPSYLVEPENTATVQIVDGNQPVVNVSTEAVTPTEATASVRFWVSRAVSTTSALTVNYAMSGTATSGADYTGATGSVVIPANVVGAYVTLPIVNDTIAEGAESITITLTSNLGVYGIKDGSATYWLLDNDSTGLPQVSFPTTTGTGAESVGIVQIPVTLSVASATPVTVQYAMNGGTATAGGVDYDSLGGTLTFAPGETTEYIPLSIRDDNLPENSETVSIALLNPSGAVLGASTYTYTITDNDTVGLIVGFAGLTSSSYESVAAPQTILVSLSAVSSTPVTVNYAVTGGTATTPADFSLPAGVLTFAPGEVAKPLPISVVYDAIAEPAAGETIIVKLTTPTGATLGANSTHTFTILEDPLFTITASLPNAAEGGANGAFVVTRAGTTNVAVTATLALSGTATSGADYQTIGTTLAFAVNQTTLTIPVTVIDDALIEGSETVIATIAPGATYKLGTASSATVTIADNDKNTSPSFVKGANITVNEDSGVQTRVAWATGISPGPAADAGQNLTFVASADLPALFVQGPAIAADGTLFFTPAPDANGKATVSVYLKDDGGTVNGGSDSSATQTFTITLTAVNDPPTLNVLNDVVFNQEAAALDIPLSGISTGAANETQTLVITVAADDPSLFSTLKVGYTSPNPTGILTLQPAPNALGSTTVRVTINDGGTENPTLTRTFAVAIQMVNHAPVFVKGADQTVPEDAGPRMVPGWANGISFGPASESAQTGDFQVGNDNPALFASAPALSVDGTLTFQTAPDASGSALVTVTLHDNGGTANGGQDTSAPQTFKITVLPVNDAPSFTKAADVTVLEDAGPQVVAGWATNRSAGPADEAGQTLTFSVDSDNAKLFSAGPAIAPDGTLRFTPAPDANGSATVSVQLHDNGGTDNGGVDVSPVQTFVINITPVNDAPTLNALGNLDISGNAGPQSVDLTGIGTGAANEVQSLIVTATSDNLAVIANPTVHYASPTATGTLTLQPMANASGTATIRVTVDDGGAENSSIVRSFQVTVTFINEAPSFVKGAEVHQLEDAGAVTIANWATSIDAGGGDSTQQVNFVVTNDNAALFSVGPAISPSGTLTFTPAPDQNGVANVKVKLHDDGGTANGGADTSAEQTFTITVDSVNDAPSFTKGGNLMLTQTAAAQTVPHWATAISAGPADESVQTLDFIVTNDQPAMFATAPMIAADGTLTFTPAAQVNGVATVTVKLHDSGGTADGGVDTSAAQTFTIRTSLVNVAPTFIMGAAPSVAQDAGAQTLAGWATHISPGADDEAAQQVHFVVTPDDPSLFSAQPAISPDGTLTFTPAPSASGETNVTVRLVDDGGTANGGGDTSAAQTFQITITTYLEEAGAYHGLVQAAAGTVLDAGHFGTAQITVTTKGKFTGRVQVGTRTTVLSGTFDKAGVATFARINTTALPLHRTGATDLRLTLQLDVGGGTDKLTGTVTDSGAPFATVETDRALYTAKKNPKAPMHNLPAARVGSYRVLFAARALAASDPAASLAPRGHGIGTLTVTTNGSARLTGTLADGTAISCSNALSKNDSWPLFAPIARGAGNLSGWLSLNDPSGANDIIGPDLHWFKPATTNKRVLLYPAGWPAGVQTDLLGSKFVAPLRSEIHSALPDLTPTDTDGNVELEMRGGSLAADLGVALNLAPNDAAAVLAPNPNRCAVKITHSTGNLTGSFYPPGATRPAAFRGVVLQKQQMAAGFFLTPTASGSIELTPMDHPSLR